MADHDHATSSSYFIYDVFLSFRGDTRHAFTDHLYRALIKKRINPFRDYPDLRLGNEIRPTLLDAIEKSRMSIVVLCGNYASSTWCLDELVKIMECKDKGRPVLPVFYQVEPREVRHQKYHFETAMIEHENRFGRDSPKVAAWRSALVAISNLSGACCNEDRYEGEIIDKIVEEVLKKLLAEPLNVNHPLGYKGRTDMKEEDVVGFKKNFNAVINQLKEKDSSRNVVSITGIGGLGKTTLARKIYNSNEVKNLFPCRAWSCVSKDYGVRKVLVSLLHCLMPSTSQIEDLNEAELKEKCRECLDEQKYLVVLDDVWEPEVWDKVRDFFPNNNDGSMILITTRNDRVANYTMSKDPHHQLCFLDVEESWELFCKKVFLEEECPPDLELIGRSIVKSCGGLPLAIIALAGLVAKKERSQMEWSRIEDLVPCWFTAEDEGGTKVMELLKVSYDDLPEKLKPCFLYFGIYPEDYEIRVREVIQLWMAEEFIQLEKTGRSRVPQPEDVGEEYLKELVDRNLVHVAKRRSDGEGVKTCRIHDLIRDLCISEGNKKRFLEVYTESNNDTITDAPRLSFLCNARSYISSITCNQSCTRSLFFFDGEPCLDDILENFQSVNVLHFSNTSCCANKLSDFQRLSRLRYLREDIDFQLDELSDCTWSPENLETLHIEYAWPMSAEIWKLKRLRHFHIYTGISIPVDEEAANDKTMPNLQTLCYVFVDPEFGILLNNGSFPNVRKLGLMFQGDPSYSLDEPLRSLHRLSNLRTLKLNYYHNETSVLSLDAIAFPSNLTKITLQDFKGLDSDYMNALGRIPGLQILKLVDGEGRTDSLNCGAAGNFPQLQVFHMQDMTHVGRLILEEGAMPRLQRVVIHGCWFLQEVPERLLSLGNLRQVDRIGSHGKYWETASNM